MAGDTGPVAFWWGFKTEDIANMNVADSIQQSSEPQKSQSSEGLYFSFQVPNQPLQSPLEVCQTAGFVQHSQNVKPPKPPSNVRFIVQPVMTEDELTTSTTSFNNEDHNTPSEPSDVAYSYRAENLSSDDLTSNYSKLFTIICIFSIFKLILICRYVGLRPTSPADSEVDGFYRFRIFKRPQNSPAASAHHRSRIANVTSAHFAYWRSCILSAVAFSQLKHNVSAFILNDDR